MTLLPFTFQPGELMALFRLKQFEVLRWRFVLLGALMVLLAFLCTRIGGIVGWLMFIGPSLLLIAGLVWGYPRMALTAMKKMPSWGRPIQYTFDEAGFTQQTAVSTATVQWQAIADARETKGWFMLSIGSPLIFYAIPKRAFEDARQQEAFRTLLQNKGLLKA